MKIFFIEKASKNILKIVPYESTSKDRFNKGEFEKLFKNYNSENHLTYLSNYIFQDFEVIDGVVTEVVEYIEPVEETIEEKNSSLENQIESIESQIETIESKILSRIELCMYRTSLETERDLLISQHSDLCFDLALLS
jgi:flagellar capping protein FliD